jgi:hypothetical protein
MGRWRKVIDKLIKELEMETPGAEGFRTNIDHEVWEAETRASESAPIHLDETPEQRVCDFQTELREALSERLKHDPAPLVQIWREVQLLLDTPRMVSVSD